MLYQDMRTDVIRRKTEYVAEYIHYVFQFYGWEQDLADDVVDTLYLHASPLFNKDGIDGATWLRLYHLYKNFNVVEFMLNNNYEIPDMGK